MLKEPKDILEEPPPRPETPREGEKEAVTIARNLRDKLARDRVMLENEERRTRGPRVGHNVFYNEVQKKLVSRLILSLGTKGKKRFLQKNPHAEISKMSFRDITELAAVSFQKVKCVTYERYKLFTRMQEPGESLEAFHAALTAQAARSELGTLERKIVRDLFISKMKNMTLQDTLTFETLDPEKVLKRAIKCEHSKLTTMAFQKTNAAATVGTGNNYNSGVRIKQEPVMAARNSKGNTKNQQYKREANKRQNNGIRDLSLLRRFQPILAPKNRESDEAQDRLRVKSRNGFGTQSNIPLRKYRRSCQGEHFSRPHSRSTEEHQRTFKNGATGLESPNYAYWKDTYSGGSSATQRWTKE